MVPVSDKHCVVLMSGGIDSSATLAACQEPGISLSGMFVDYGQPAVRSEWEAAQRIASHYQIHIDKVDLGISLGIASGLRRRSQDEKDSLTRTTPTHCLQTIDKRTVPAAGRVRTRCPTILDKIKEPL